MKTLDDLDFKGKRVFMRVDFNVPLDKERRVKDDLRICAVLPSIRKVIDSGGRLILASHLGRPKGKVSAEFSLRPIAEYLSNLLGKSVPLAPDCVGPEVEKQVSLLKEGEALLLENLRFHPEEEKNDPEFSKRLAELADIYVNEAFAASHRAHASVEGITRFVPVCAAGYQLQKELQYFKKVMENPQRAARNYCGRRESIDQTRAARKSYSQNRYPDYRRRNGQYVFQGAGEGSRQIAG